VVGVSFRLFRRPYSRRIFFLCVTVGNELLVGVAIGAVGVRVRVSRVGLGLV